MTDDEPRVEFVRRTTFAEEAEAIGIPSDLVISATDRDYGHLVMYTASEKLDEAIMGALMRRDRDGIYRVIKTGPTGSTLRDWVEDVSAKMRDRKTAAHEEAHDDEEPQP